MERARQGYLKLGIKVDHAAWRLFLKVDLWSTVHRLSVPARGLSGRFWFGHLTF